MTETRPTIADKRRAFQQLHSAGCFVIPNPWDVGSARYLQSLGFKALATTSSGFAWSCGYSDGAVSRDMALAHLREIVAATDLPVNADFESGFALDAPGVEESVRLAVETGVAGLSIEDSTGDAAKPLYDVSVSVERMRAARRAIDKAGGDTLAPNVFLWAGPISTKRLRGSRSTPTRVQIASMHPVFARVNTSAL